jgi:hypothetical protein
MQYIMCQDDDQDCQTWITCSDDSANCMSNGGWSDDGHTDDGTDDAPIQYDDDAWQNDGYASNNLQGSYATKAVQNDASTPVWPFLLAALVAGVVGVAFVVLRRKKRQSEADDSSVASTKRRRLFNFGRKKQGALNEDFDNESNYVEMSR